MTGKSKVLRHPGVVLSAVLAVLMATASAHAQEARLSELRVSNRNNDFVLYLKVEGAFTEEIKEAVLSGVSTSFTFFVILSRVRSYWFDKKIADITITHTLKYNNMKKEFLIRRSWEGDRTVVVKTFSEARRLMTEIDNMSIISLSMLKKGEQYRLMTKAELGRITLPLYLHYVLFFVSLWDFETDWYTIDFIY